ncbi:MAG: hypothetical protein J6W82_10445 [Bacteroidales bacterium]|nr:hypothetical protein [Bacteroidales bacterium]
MQSSAIDVNQTAQLVTDGLMAGESKYIEIRLSDVHGRFRLETEGMNI